MLLFFKGDNIFIPPKQLYLLMLSIQIKRNAAVRLMFNIIFLSFGLALDGSEFKFFRLLAQKFTPF